MSSTQNEKCKGNHFTWSKPMSHMLLEILAEEAFKGSKPSSTFKAESFVKVATKISQKFNVQCEPACGQLSQDCEKRMGNNNQT